MKFRAGLVVGFGAGFYLGTMAGRERYHQMNRMIRRAKRSNALDAVSGRAKAVADAAGDRFGRSRTPDATDMTGARLVRARPQI